MADCGATGSTLDRTVGAVLGGSRAGVKLAPGALFGALLHPSHAQSMPTTAPQTLIMPSSLAVLHAPGGATGMVAQAHQAPTAASSPLYHHPQQQQQHPTASLAHHHAMMPHQPHPAMFQQQQQQQQQQMMQQMNMMMNWQQQQQQQQQAMMQQQQQAQQQSPQQQQQTTVASHDPIADALQSVEEAGLDAETKQALQEHLEALHADEQTTGGGAGMEDLAAAWAQAEADYQAETAGVDWGAAIAQEAPPTERYTFRHTDLLEQQAPGLDWMAQGLDHFERGRIVEAIRCFEGHLQGTNADDARAWRMLGRCHAESDQDREAILCLEEAVDRDPYATDALLALAVSHVNELNHAKALEALQGWITHNTAYAGMELTDDVYGAAAASTTSVEGDVAAFDQVQRLLLRALEVDPTHTAEILQTLGVVYNVSRDYEAAAHAFRRALEERPNDYQLWNKLGATLANSNQSDQALPAYNKALELRPRYARAWLNMAISYSNLRNYDEAARCYLQTLSLNPAATHCWSYLRIALSCSERWDLIPLAASQDLAAFAEHFDFVFDSTPGTNGAALPVTPVDPVLG
jgi:peroxin-5